MTKSEADYYLHRCYRLLADPELTLRHRKLRGSMQGLAYHAVNSITVDFRKEALSTILHECLHVLYPDLCETKIIALERGIINEMSDRQFRNLCLRIGART